MQMVCVVGRFVSHVLRFEGCAAKNVDVYNMCVPHLIGRKYTNSEIDVFYSYFRGVGLGFRVSPVGCKKRLGT